MQDNANMEKGQAEKLSAAIDGLNQGLLLENTQEEELAELIFTAKLIKAAAEPPVVPPAVLNHIVEQTVNTIAREKRKKRLTWGLVSLTGTVAAVVLVALLNVVPPISQEQQLAKTPAPAVETPQPPLIEKKIPEVTISSPKNEIQAPADGTKATVPEQPALEATQSPAVDLTVPSVPIPSTGDADSMLALADRKADVVTFDAISKTIRQVYRQGAPDEIIITQAPKRTDALRAEPVPPQAQIKMAVRKENADIKLPNRNKVIVTIDNSEVTLEGAVSQEELLNLAHTLTKVNVAR